MTETVKIYETEVPKELWEDIKEKIQELDPAPPSRQSYSKKQINVKGLALLSYLLEEEYEDISMNINEAQRKIDNMRDVLGEGYT